MEFDKKQFDRMIAFSQNCALEDVHSDNLIHQWEKAKAPYIKEFGGTIYRSEEPISIYMTLDAQHDEFLRAMREIRYTMNCSTNSAERTEELVNFFTANEVGFFNNVVAQDDPAHGIKCGDKILRSLKKRIPEEELRRKIQDIVSQHIQKKKITGYLYFSVDPRDFLTLSDNNEGWSSCHATNNDYCIGNLNYMVDPSTIVVYLAGSEPNAILDAYGIENPWYSKKWRMLIHVSSRGELLFNRQYPFNHDSLVEIVWNTYRKIFQPCYTLIFNDVIDTFSRVGDASHLQLSLFNKFLVDEDRYNIIQLGDKIDKEDYYGYCDLIENDMLVPFLATTEGDFKEEGTFKIGEIPYCPICDELIDWSDEDSDKVHYCCIKCENKLHGVYYCENCGRRVTEEEVIEINGHIYCEECADSMNEEDDKEWQDEEI